jgi:hypothetical protein
MNSATGHGHYTMGCACTVAPEGSSVLPPGVLDMRFELPRASLFTELPCVMYPRQNRSAGLLAGYIVPPDQPPKALFA